MKHSFKYIVLIVIYILLSSYISLIYAFTEQEIVQLNNIFGQIINIINETRVSLENKIVSLENKIAILHSKAFDHQFF